MEGNMENNTTAVDWLIEQMKELDRNGFNLQVSKLNELGMQAREMEREQIIESYYAGTAQFANEAPIVNPKTPNDYYNETYGK
jgi:hypothetical protein